MHQAVASTFQKPRGLARAPRNFEWQDNQRIQELLDLGFARFEAATELPLEPGLRHQFEAIYRPSAMRLVDRRVWRIVGGQLLDWVSHVGQLAQIAAQNRGASKIVASHLYTAVKEVHEISASSYCVPIPDSEDPGVASSFGVLDTTPR